MGPELGRHSSPLGRFSTNNTSKSPVVALIAQKRIWIGVLVCVGLVVLLRQSYVSRERLFGADSDEGRENEEERMGLIAGTGYTSSFKSNGKGKKVVKAVHNGTLGFGEIFMPVMPHRSDQMDTAALLGHLTGISITTVPGVYPKDINRVALPLGDYSPNEAGVLGAWRAHLNVMREIVQRNLSTALIFEADADWDVSFKDQLSRMAENMPSGDEEAPYGLDWEMIWLGVSGNAWDRSLLKPATALWKDDSLPTVDAMAGFVKETYAAYGIQGDGWRIMAPAHTTVCTAAFAVTYAGAYRILYELGYNELHGPTDLELSRLGRDGKLKAMVVIPPLIGQYRTGSAADSEINAYGGKFEGNEKGDSGGHIVQSARKSLKTLYSEIEDEEVAR